MRILIFSLLIISFVYAAPAQDECREELARAKECGTKIPDNVWKIVSKEEFERNNEHFKTFYTCLGDLQCDITKSIKRMEAAKWDIVQKMTEIHACAGNNAYDNIKTRCSMANKHTDCKDPEFYSCIITGLEKNSNCTANDIEKYRGLINPIQQACQMKRDHKKEFKNYGGEEIEFIND